MSETKFTPGPWRYNIATNGEVVAPQERGKDKTVVESDAANPFDSRLIAAAPELYEALEDCARFIENDVVGHGGPEKEQARAALAKARGE